MVITVDQLRTLLECCELFGYGDDEKIALIEDQNGDYFGTVHETKGGTVNRANPDKTARVVFK